MSQTTDRRKEGKFGVLTDAIGLTVHTLKITANEKVFTPEYRYSVTDDIIRSAKRVYDYAWNANEIRFDGTQENWKKRNELQQKAIMECNGLLPKAQIARKVFHLDTKKFIFWSKMIIKVRDELKKWNQSDKRRYGM